MLERKKFKLHSGFFSIVLRRLGQSSCHSCIKKRNLGIISHCLFGFLTMKERLEHWQRLIWGLQQANWGWHRWECQELGKGRKWAALSCRPPVLASLFPHVFSIMLCPEWHTGCLHGCVTNYFWSRNKLPNLKMFFNGDRCTYSLHGSSLQGFWGAGLLHSCVHKLHGWSQSLTFLSFRLWLLTQRTCFTTSCKMRCFYGRASGDTWRGIIVLYVFAGK